MKHLRNPLIALVLLAAFFAVAASAYFKTYNVSFGCKAALYFDLVFLTALALMPRTRFVFPLVLIPYFVYAAGCGDFRWMALLRLIAITGVPVGVYYAFPVRDVARLCWQDVIVGTWFVLAMILRQTNGIFNVPVNLDFMMRLVVIAVGAWCWVSLRPVPDLGYRFAITGQTLKAAGLNFLLFAAIAIPVSFALNFARWNPRWHGGWNFVAEFIEIFVFIAWLEEMFFRGFLQTLVDSRLIASLIFGLSHILHAPVPNWRYVLLASIAGWFYGSAFKQGGGLMASSLTHAAVDAVWRTWFGRG